MVVVGWPQSDIQCGPEASLVAKAVISSASGYRSIRLTSKKAPFAMFRPITVQYRTLVVEILILVIRSSTILVAMLLKYIKQTPNTLKYVC